MAGLLADRRFLPLFACQMLGALNDNLFKNAIVVLILFRQAGQPWLIAAAGGIFILPYALFSAFAGRLADRLEKSRLIRFTKAGEIGLMLLALLALSAGSQTMMLLVLFGLGIQATLFGPLKYGILPELLPPPKLLEGNALIEASTFIGILVGTVLGGEIVLLPNGPEIAGSSAVLVALLGYAAARAVPRTAPAAPFLPADRNLLGGGIALLAQARAQPIVWICILALSWFWALGATFLAEFPVIVKQQFAAGGQVVTLLLAIFSVGVGAGSMLANRFSQGRIEARLVVPATLLLSLFGLDFAWVSFHVDPADGWHSLAAIAAHANGLRLMADLFAVAACGGVYSVPLYALLQHHAPADRRARMVAANNVVNAGFIVASAALLAAGSALGLPASVLLAVFTTANIAVAWLIHRARLPSGQQVVRPLSRR